MFRLLSLLAILGTASMLFPASSVALAAPSLAAAHETIPMFAAESAAQAHCPSDTVVWLNTRTGIWHEKGMRWYGRTKDGAYVCRKEAAAAGYRDTRNGQ